MASSRPVRRVAVALVALPLVALLASPILGVTIAQPWHVDGASMEPAIGDGSVLLVDGVGPQLTGYGRGDIVVLRVPAGVPAQATVLVKRIVGLAGDRIVIEGGRVRLNGARVPEPYLALGTVTVISRTPGARLDVTVPAGSVFVMGDHRENSFDSKAFGPVPLDRLVGRVWFAVRPDGSLELPSAAATGD